MGRTWLRRAVTIPGLYLLLGLAVALAPIALSIALVVDLVRFARSRRPFMASRLYVFGCVYRLDEAMGRVALLAVWIGGGLGAGREARVRRGAYAVQSAWAQVLFVASRWMLGLRYEVEGEGAAAPGPILVFIQHTSVLDTLIPTCIVARQHGLRLRFVLKRELLISPCLDVAGHMLPNVFVDRSGAQTAREVSRIRALAANLSSSEGALIYPEGTRFTPAKLVRAVEKLQQTDPDLHEQARGLSHLLPPRLGGALALLEGAPDADCLFIAHHGLEGFEKVEDLWDGGLVGARVKIRMWRRARADVPVGQRERAKWIYREWQGLDDWLGAVLDRAA